MILMRFIVIPFLLLLSAYLFPFSLLIFTGLGGMFHLLDVPDWGRHLPIGGVMALFSWGSFFLALLLYADSNLFPEKSRPAFRIFYSLFFLGFTLLSFGFASGFLKIPHGTV